MRLRLDLAFFVFLIFVLIFVLFIVGLIYSSGIKRNIYCAGPLAFLPLCDLTNFILPNLNEPIGSICQTGKQCNGFGRGVDCCQGVCTNIDGYSSCSQYCNINECGRKADSTTITGQPCIFDSDCLGQSGIDLFPERVCCAGVCRVRTELPVTGIGGFHSCRLFCEENPNCRDFLCRI